MHIVTWKYEVMEGKNRSDLLAVVNASAARIGRPAGLVRRYSALGAGLATVIEFWVWTSKEAADAWFDLAWDSETSRLWESARMTREDFEVVGVVEPQRTALPA